MTPERQAMAGTGVPIGVVVELDIDTKELEPGVLFGGSPARALRLSAAGRHALEQLRKGPVASAAAGLVARRLTDAGLAHPRPSSTSSPADVTVVVPVRDRADALDRCLEALGADHPVIVVDDGSVRPEAAAAICAAHGARLERHEVNRGPAAARNRALALVDTELVAFVDSDCVPPPGWIEHLAGHFRDPLVGAVAPRIVAMGAATTAAGRYAAARSPLDLGTRPARVAPLSRVAYVPTAALVVRRRAIDGFDEQLRFGEDVDLVWRLDQSGWRVRYDPSVQVAHAEPDRWGALFRRRYRYGTSGAPLAHRHPGRVSPLVLHPWPTITVAALLGRRPALAAAGVGMATGTVMRRLARAGLSSRGVLRPTVTGVEQTWLGLGRWINQFASPAALAALIHPGRRHRVGRRLAVASLLLGPPLLEWARRRPPLGPVPYILAVIAEEAAYGAGVWRGCRRERLLEPVIPTVSWKSFLSTSHKRSSPISTSSP